MKSITHSRTPLVSGAVGLVLGAAVQLHSQSSGGVVTDTHPVTEWLEIAGPSALLHHGLVTHWSFDEGFENTLPGFSGTPTEANIDTTDSVIGGGSARFDVEQYVEIQGSPIPVDGKAFTVACWFKVEPSSSADRQIVWTTRPSAFTSLGIQLADPDGTTTVTARLAGAEASAEIEGFDAEAWHHAAVTFSQEAQAARLYLDGDLVTQQTGIAIDGANMDVSGFLLGAGYVENVRFVEDTSGGLEVIEFTVVEDDYLGWLDDLAVWNRSLDDREIAGLAAVAPVARFLKVSNLADSGEGSLRQVLYEAEAGMLVEFSEQGSIELTGGPLVIDKPVAILGPGMDRLTITRADRAAEFRILEVTVDAVATRGLTLANGVAPVREGGSGVLNRGTLLLEEVRLTDHEGGTIKNEGTLTVRRSSIEANRGQGIFNVGALVLEDSTVRDNEAERGAGLYHAGGAAQVRRSTFSGNHASEIGGALLVASDNLTLENCTLSANRAGNLGGGLATLKLGTAGPRVDVNHCTFLGNSAPAGGGILVFTGEVHLRNSIVAYSPAGGNFGGTAPISEGRNLSSDRTGGLREDIDLVETDPRLSPLGDHGGDVSTHLPLDGSPAIDAGTVDGGPATDQRGRPRVHSSHADLGAVERTFAQNDHLAFAIALPSEEVVDVEASDRRAGRTPDRPGTLPHSRWWTWTAPRSGPVAIIATHTDSSEAGYVAAYQLEEPDTLVLVAQGHEAMRDTGDNAGVRYFAAEAAFEAEAGSSYYLAANGAGATDSFDQFHEGIGSFMIRYFNDEFDQRQELRGDDLVFTTGNVSATGFEDHGVYFNSRHTLWWTWTAPRHGSLEVTLDAGSEGTLAVYQGGSAGDLDKLVATDMARTGSVRLNVVEGEEYHIGMGHSSFSGFEYDQDAIPGPIALRLELHDPPPNDSLGDRFVIGPGELTTRGTNIGASPEPEEARPHPRAVGSSVWWQWTSPRDQTVSLSTAGSDFNTVLAVYELDNPDGPVELQNLRLVDGDSVNALDPVLVAAEHEGNEYLRKTSRITFSANRGRTYYISVDGFRTEGKANDPNTGAIVLVFKQISIHSFDLIEREIDPPVSGLPVFPFDDGPVTTFSGAVRFRNFSPTTSSNLRLRLEARADTVSWIGYFGAEEPREVPFVHEGETKSVALLGRLGPGESISLSLSAETPQPESSFEDNVMDGHGAKFWGVVAILEMQAGDDSDEWTAIDASPLVYSVIPALRAPTPEVGPNGAPIRVDSAIDSGDLPRNIFTAALGQRTEFALELGGGGDAGQATLTAFRPPKLGELAIDGNRVAYTPNASPGNLAAGMWDAFVLNVSRGGAVVDRATVQVQLTLGPQAVEDLIRVDEGREATVLVNGHGSVLFNDSDPEADQLQAVLIERPAHGDFHLDADGTFHYRHDGSEAHADSFTYRVSDGLSESAPATVAIEVQPSNDAPIGLGSNYETTENTPIEIVLSGSDADNDPLTFTLLEWPAHGTLEGDGPRLTYTPRPQYSGTDSLTFQVSDAELTSAPATVSITVTAVDDPPTAASQSVVTDEDLPVLITLAGNDPDGSALAYTVIDAPVHGRLSGDMPRLIYVPHNDYHGPDGFSFRVSDGTSESDPATVSIDIRSVNDEPVAASQSLETDQEFPMPITLSGTDPEGEALTFTILEPPTHGTLQGLAPELVYLPDVDYHGPDTLRFEVSDGADTSAPATIAILVRQRAYLDPPSLAYTVSGGLLELRAATDARYRYTLESTSDFRVWTAVPGIDWPETGTQTLPMLIEPHHGKFFRLKAEPKNP